MLSGASDVPARHFVESTLDDADHVTSTGGTPNAVEALQVRR